MWQLKSKSGFSLIELLVVISIIGILVAIGMASYTNIQQRARDATRRSDVQAMANAMEQYFSEIANQSYPNDGSNNCVYADINSYFSGPLPGDPRTGLDYDCTATDSVFMVCADLEVGGGNGQVPVNDGDPYIFGGNGTAFCVGNRQ